MARRAVIPLSIVALAAATLVAPSSGSPARQSATRAVSIKDDRFSPKTVHVGARGRVTWTWKGQNDHNVTFRHVPRGASKKPRARTRSSGTFTRKFTIKGKYRYVCTIHEDLGMKGTVVVE
jgi:plastocyanin